MNFFLGVWCQRWSHARAVGEVEGSIKKQHPEGL